ncbi:protein kinase [Schaalia sp. 19OD2882]|uniref:protein kinase domain-containing protein n=1 Tax=Schaalia sp. 19OD2882 TaxID=2794089 RepID=UPI001C1EB5F9|nr:protein kinase [Schaalia sp. 19OD2882]QWW18742.1 protein kinase [Schaalia sp. 19OD2882]
MEINGYELGPVVHMTASGPMWSTCDQDGAPALLRIHTAEEAEALVERWRLWAQVDSPHVVRLVDVVAHEDGRVALVQERVSGRPLDALLEAPDPVRPKQARRILADIKAALTELHRAGLVHTDVSPSNILVHPRRGAVLVDVGEEVGEGGGTPGWNADLPKTAEGDLAALERLAQTLGVRVPDASAMVDVDNDAAGPTLPESVTPEGAVAALRAAAARTPTRGADKGEVGRDEASAIAVAKGRTSSRPRPLVGAGARRIALVTAAVASLGIGVGLGLTQGILRADAGGTGDASASAGAVAGGVCPTPGRLAARIQEVIDARDTALGAQDGSGLEGLVGGPLLASDQELITSLAERKVELRGYDTTLLSIGEVTCTGAGVDLHVTVAVEVRQEEHERCEAGTCRTVSAGPPVRLELHLEGNDLNVQVAERQS